MTTEYVPPTSADIKLPLCLYGDKPTAIAAWKAVHREVRKAKSWSAVADYSDMVSVNSYPGDVILDPPYWGVDRRDEVHWRLNLITEAIPPRHSAAGRRRFLEGMEYCWFTIGVLSAANLPYFPDEGKAEATRNLFLPMLEKFVYWLPEIMALWSRFADGFQVYLRTGETLPQINHLPTFAQQVRWMRPELDFDQLNKLTLDFRGDLIRAMLEMQLIECQEDRYRWAAIDE